MPQNRIQFQPGLSMIEFHERYGTEAKCEEALVAARWPEGFRCPRCLGRAAWATRRETHPYRLCAGCGYQCSLSAGTVLHNTKLPLRVWFLAMHLLGQAKNGVSALELKRQLGVSYPTAWLIAYSNQFDRILRFKAASPASSRRQHDAITWFQTSEAELSTVAGGRRLRRTHDRRGGQLVSCTMRFLGRGPGRERLWTTTGESFMQLWRNSLPRLHAAVCHPIRTTSPNGNAGVSKPPGGTTHSTGDSGVAWGNEPNPSVK